MSTTVLELISSSMRLLGWLSPGQTPSGSEAANFLSVLQQMREQWETEGLTLYQRKVVPCQLTVTKSNFTIGTGATDFNTDRPISIEDAVGIVGNLRLPIKQFTANQWAELRQRLIAGDTPEVFYPDYAFPLMTLNFWPLSAALVELTVVAPLQAFTTLTTALALPPGYEVALRTNLAVMLAPEMGALDPTIASLAVSSKQGLQQFNARVQGLGQGAQG